MTPVSIGLGATKAPWSAAFRAYVRDHGQGMAVQVVLDRASLERSAANLDVLVIDDLMRTFSVLDIARAQDRGTRVVGLFDQGLGMGRPYVSALGVDHVAPATMSPVELASLVLQLGPRQGTAPAALGRPPWPVAEAARGGPRGRAVLSAWTKVSGGSGLTEALVAAAETTTQRSRVLVIEAEELSPILASRLSRSTDAGLPWALSRAGQGLRALPGSLSGPREDGARPVGHFDIICAAPGAAPALNPAHFVRLVAEALTAYDHVMVETGWLVGPTSSRERFAAVGDVLALADSIVVLASADPEGAARLVEWKASAAVAGIGAPCTAAFGRCRKGRYEKDHLAGIVLSNTGSAPFAGVAFLPEDPTVARARWNGELVWGGSWLKAVQQLAASHARPVAGPHRKRQVLGGRRLRANGSAAPEVVGV